MRLRRLAVLLVLAILVAVSGGVFTGRLLAQPEQGLASVRDAGAGLRLQQALAELAMRAASVSPRTEPVVVTPAELNTFLARHLESRRLPLQSPLIASGEDRLEVTGRTSTGGLAGRSWLGAAFGLLPRPVRELDLWVSARGRLVVRAGEAEFVVEETRVGQQRVPASWVWGALGIDPREQLHWRLPRVVERIEARPGRLLIYTRRHGR